MLRRMVEQATEWQIPVFVMDCDVTAAFDHVSHQEIIKATLAMGVPPDPVATWIREYRNTGEAGRYCDAGNSAHKAIFVRRTCLGQLWTHQLRSSVTCADTKNGVCLLETGILVSCSSRTIAGSSRCGKESSKRWPQRGTNC